MFSLGCAGPVEAKAGRQETPIDEFCGICFYLAVQAQSKLKQEGKLPDHAQMGWRAIVGRVLRESGVRGFWVR
jgi:hypothetical protein